MSGLMVTMIPQDHVRLMWPRVRWFMERAADYTYGRYEADDILFGLENYNHHLWVAFEPHSGVKGAVVTGLKKYPRKLYLDLIFIGGEEGMSWKDEMLKVLRCWARDNDCDGIESTGRFGWAKIFKNDGYHAIGQAFELPLTMETENE